MDIIVPTVAEATTTSRGLFSYNPLPSIDLHTLVFTRTHDTDVFVPTDTEDLHAFSADPFPFAFRAFSLNGVRAFAYSAILLALARSDIPNPAGTIMTPAD